MAASTTLCAVRTHAGHMLIEARLLVCAKQCTNALTGSLHDREVTRAALILGEALIAKRLMLRMCLGHDLTYRRRLRGIEVEVLLHARDMRLGVAATGTSMAATMPSAAMLAMTSSRRCGVLR